MRTDIHTLGELARLPTGPLRTRHARLLAVLERELSGAPRSVPLGRERPAFSEYDPSGLHLGSISNERTFFDTLRGDEKSLEQLLELSERVCFRARKRGVRARTITLKLRYTDFRTINRSRTGEPTDDEARVMGTLVELFRASRERRLAIRLLGVALSNLVGAGDPEQLTLPFERVRPVGGAMDQVRKKYGYDSVHLGGAMRRARRPGGAPPGSVSRE
jgi:DNA polymerase-4